ncbi:CRISPR system precrRNA processing endoribonuclease RAMP protein Cas6 [Micromonospora musae]|uniref:CRISPR system precrRNA processing endoribonuclease RAMP protein Cas6 n=1 Tax=Micromonospora musae TaxID=1894970 RepID=A0A3A9Y960_9ACTN|nr:CRISPR system precrRNA processing endoribonuclease RAMP protein Cas6 [Micromonospora musae]RKN33828.1 CRISPR system precrRNA processing endoribonuclease RAMP protein Cas6 [Micromonospora musae]
MPTQWTINLATPVDLSAQPYHDHLHAFACGFFQEGDEAHHADDKPFTARLQGPPDKCAGVILSWLPDTPPPATGIPQRLRFGAHWCEVTEARIQRIPLERLTDSVPARRVRLMVTTPAKFRQHGRDYPLPDPYLIYSTLARRFRSAGGQATDDDVRELSRTALLYAHNIHTEPYTWHGARSAGFLGTISLGLPRTAPPGVSRLFATLNGFMVIAGLGHGTTHGLGSTELLQQ